MIKAIIFDLDGVIADTEPLHFQAAQKTLLDFGIDLNLDDYLELGVSKGARYMFEKLEEKYGIKIDKEKAFQKKKELFQEIFQENIIPREGIVELVKTLSEGYVLAIASSGVKESVNLVLEKLGIKKYFQIIVTSEDIERVKPFPDIYLKCCERLGIKTIECVAIEDSETGVESAKAAGIKCIAVPCEFTKLQNFFKADLRVNELKEITKEKIKSI